MPDLSTWSNKIALAAVLLTVLTIALTVLIKSILLIADNGGRISVVEKGLLAVQQDIQVIQADIKQILKEK
jgi:hypothetical protein